MTIADLQKAHDELAKEQKPLKEALGKIQKRFEDLWIKYLDDQLKDKNGKTVKVGDCISNGKKTHHVVDRGLQNIFGTLVDNPRVMVIPFEGGSHNRAKHIHREQLKEFEIVKI